MIDGYCRTNLDDYKREEWPTQFVAVPRIRESVQSLSGASLKVHDVTYFMLKSNPMNPPNDDERRPAIIVELHK